MLGPPRGKLVPHDRGVLGPPLREAAADHIMQELGLGVRAEPSQGKLAPQKAEWIGCVLGPSLREAAPACTRQVLGLGTVLSPPPREAGTPKAG